MNKHQSTLYDETVLSRLDAIEPSITDMATAIRTADSYLTRKLMPAPKDVTHGVLLSGGVDSAILAAKLKALGHKLVCFTAGTSDSSDLDHAQETANALGLEWHACVFDKNKTVDDLKRLTELLQYSGLYTIASAMVVDICLKKMHELEIHNAWAANGLGFGWHENKNRTHAESITAPHETWQETRAALQRAFGKHDNVNMYARLGDHHNVDMHLPLEGEDGIAVARSIASQVHNADDIDKAILRNLAMHLGLPAHIAYRPKDPLQHSSRTFEFIREAMYKVAKQQLEDQVSFDWNPETDEYLDLRFFVATLLPGSSPG